MIEEGKRYKFSYEGGVSFEATVDHFERQSITDASGVSRNVPGSEQIVFSAEGAIIVGSPHVSRHLGEFLFFPLSALNEPGLTVIEVKA